MAHLSINIRQATIMDAQPIAESHVRSWQWAYKGIVSQAYLDSLSEPEALAARIARNQERLTHTPPQSRWWVVQQAERIVGFAITGTITGTELRYRMALN